MKTYHKRRIRDEFMVVTIRPPYNKFDKILIPVAAQLWTLCLRRRDLGLLFTTHKIYGEYWLKTTYLRGWRDDGDYYTIDVNGGESTLFTIHCFFFHDQKMIIHCENFT